MKFLLYSRSDSSRKAYYGTYSLFSSKISGRRPLTVDNRIHDYEADTEEEFEIEPDGEYLKDDDDEDEEDVDPAEKLRAADGFEEDDFVSTDNESGQDSDIEAGMDGVKLDRVVKVFIFYFSSFTIRRGVCHVKSWKQLSSALVLI